MKAARTRPYGGEIRSRHRWLRRRWRWRRRLRCSHGFTIQLGTEVRKRAATTVVPGWYCTATTEASVSSEPSELRKRRTSANSSGVVQAKSTSREVPNSMTVLSSTDAAPGRFSLLAFLLRVNGTGMRTGVASGKKRASSATVLVCAVRDGAVPCCPIRGLVKMRLGSPSSRLGRASGSQNTRLWQKEEHDQDHSAERKD